MNKEILRGITSEFFTPRPNIADFVSGGFMKYSVVSTDLQKALAKIIHVVPTKSTMPIVENILMDLQGNALRMTATDLDIFMTIEIPVTGEEDGRIAVPARRLHEIVRSLSSMELDVNADHVAGKMVMKTRQGEYRMSGETADNFPAKEDVDEVVSFALSSERFSQIIATTAFAVSTDELRPAMMGVLFEMKPSELRAVATDGHRLVRVIQSNMDELPLSEGEVHEVVIPARALNLILKSMESEQVDVRIGSASIRFSMDELELQSRIIDEKYPKYESVIPVENDKVLSVNRAALLAAVRRVSIFSNSITNQIRFFVSDGELRVSAEDIDFGGEAKESLPCAYTGESIEIGFNSKYIEDALVHLEGEEVTFEFSSPTRAGVMRPSQPLPDQDILMLVMPVRLNA